MSLKLKKIEKIVKAHYRWGGSTRAKEAMDMIYDVIKDNEIPDDDIPKEKIYKMITEIDNVKSAVNEIIIDQDRNDLIDFVNGINQCLVIISKYCEVAADGMDKSI